MSRRPPRFKPTDTRFPETTLFRLLLGKAFRARGQGLHFGAHVDGLHLIADAGGVGAEALVLTLPARQRVHQPLLRVVQALLVRRVQAPGEPLAGLDRVHFRAQLRADDLVATGRVDRSLQAVFWFYSGVHVQLGCKRLQAVRQSNGPTPKPEPSRSEEHTSELQSLMRTSY